MTPNALGPQEIESLLVPFYANPSPLLLEQLAAYLDLLLRWNERTNLTAIRDPREIVQRHFGESLFAASFLDGTSTLLDYGSGAGFPGIPIALSRPEMIVTLAESQNKKSSFLREAIRSLQMPVEVWPHRVEDLPSTRSFDCVTLRAVDRMGDALAEAGRRASRQMLVLTSHTQVEAVQSTREFEERRRSTIPGSHGRLILQMARRVVPRGT